MISASRKSARRSAAWRASMRGARPMFAKVHKSALLRSWMWTFLLVSVVTNASPALAATVSRHCGTVKEGGRSTYIAALGIVSDPRGGPRAPSCVNARRVAKAWLRFEAPYYDPGFHGGDESCVKTAHRGGECTIRVPGLGLWDCGYYGRHNAKGRCTRPGGSVIRWRASTSSGGVFGG